MKTVIIQEIYKDPLTKLSEICANFEVPSLSELENILKSKNTTIGYFDETTNNHDKIKTPFLYYQWRSLHNMFYVFKQLKTYIDKFPDGRRLIKSLFVDVTDLYKSVINTNSAKPVPKDYEAIEVNTLLFNTNVKNVQQKANALHVKIHGYYLNEICKLIDNVRSGNKEQLITKNKNEISTETKQEKHSLIEFMELFCIIKKGENLKNKANYIHKASRESKIELPSQAGDYQKGQSKFYHLDDLVKTWPDLCKKLPTIPELDPQKIVNR